MKVQREALTNTAKACSDRVVANAKPGTKSVDALIPVFRFCDIFDAAVERLGLLQRQEVALVLNAHLSLKQLTPKLQMIASRVPPQERGVEYQEKPIEYILIADRDVQLVGKMHESHVPAFDKAINELGSKLR